MPSPFFLFMLGKDGLDSMHLSRGDLIKQIEEETKCVGILLLLKELEIGSILEKEISAL